MHELTKTAKDARQDKPDIRKVLTEIEADLEAGPETEEQKQNPREALKRLAGILLGGGRTSSGA